MPNNIEPDIAITFPDRFPHQLFDDIRKELDSENLKLIVHEKPFGGPYASVEWAIPTLIGIFVFKSYFDGFLKEAGKDHYNLLKSWLKKTSGKSRLITVTTITARGSEDKLKKGDTQSKAFSIEIKTNTNQKIKFMFDEQFDQEVWNSAIEKALQMLDEHYTNIENNELSTKIKEENLEHSLFARINKDTMEWEFLDAKKMYLEHKQNLK